MNEIEKTRSFFNKENVAGGVADSPIQNFTYESTCACFPRADGNAAYALDVGCNRGRYTKYLAQRFARVWAVDYAELALKSAEQADNIEYVCLDVDKNGVRLRELFPRMDLVIAIGLFEMVLSPAELMSNCHAVVRPGGQIFVVIPNRFSLNFVVLRTIMWIGRTFLGKNWFIYYNGITPQLLRSYVVNAGFDIQKDGTIIGLPVYLIDRLPYSIQSFLIRMDSLFKGVCGGGYYWVSGVRTS